jgi:hypothetical protein
VTNFVGPSTVEGRLPDITIKDAPEETVRALEAIARTSRRTVSAVALDYLPKRAPPLREHATSAGTLRERLPTERAGPDSTAPIRRDRDGLPENELPAEEAIRLARELRSGALKAVLPDSAPATRADRDSR